MTYMPDIHGGDDQDDRDEVLEELEDSELNYLEEDRDGEVIEDDEDS